MKRIVTTALLIMGLNACSMASMSFADRNDLIAAQGYEGLDEIAYNGYMQPRTIKTLGTLTMNNNFGKTDDTADARVFQLKRDKSKFYAETSLFTSDNKDRTFFDETLINFGMDKKQKGMNVELTLKF